MKLKHYWNSSTNIFIATFLGVLCGLYIPFFAEWIKPLGDLFIKLVRMLVIPIVFFSILSSTIKLKHTGESAFRALLCFLGLLFLASVLAIVVGYFMPINIEMQSIPKEMLNGEVLYHSQIPVSKGFGGFILNMIPVNIMESFFNGNILQVVLFSLFLGLGLASYKGVQKKGLESGIYTLSEVLGWMMSKIMILSPLAVFSLMAYAVSAMGTGILYQMGLYLLCFIGVVLFWIYIVLGLFVTIKGKVSYLSWVQGIFPLQIFALSTSSSLVCLPLNIKITQSLGAHKQDAQVLLPIGTTVNLQATAMYYLLSAIFFAKVFGVHLFFSQYVAMVATAILGSAAAAGIPGTSLLIASVFLAGGVPLSALPLLFAVDRLFDMFVTMGNVVGNTATVLMVKK